MLCFVFLETGIGKKDGSSIFVPHHGSAQIGITLDSWFGDSSSVCNSIVLKNGVFGSTGNETNDYFNVEVDYDGNVRPVLYVSSTCDVNGTQGIESASDSFHGEVWCIGTLNDIFQTNETFKSGYYIGLIVDSFESDTCVKSPLIEDGNNEDQSISKEIVWVINFIFWLPLLFRIVLVVCRLINCAKKMSIFDRYRPNCVTTTISTATDTTNTTATNTVSSPISDDSFVEDEEEDDQETQPFCDEKTDDVKITTATSDESIKYSNDTETISIQMVNTMKLYDKQDSKAPDGKNVVTNTDDNIRADSHNNHPCV